MTSSPSAEEWAREMAALMAPPTEQELEEVLLLLKLQIADDESLAVA